jgi:hypothetical protein
MGFFDWLKPKPDPFIDKLKTLGDPWVIEFVKENDIRTPARLVQKLETNAVQLDRSRARLEQRVDEGDSFDIHDDRRTLAEAAARLRAVRDRVMRLFNL